MTDVLVTGAEGDAIRTVVLNRPAKRNALTRAMFATLLRIFRNPPADTQRAVVLRASGPAFCGGVDLAERVENLEPDQPNELEQLCEALRTYQLPIIAVVHGSAVGGGMMLALHCDFVVAAADAKLGNPAAQLGLVPPWPLSRTVLDVAGPVIGRKLLLFGDPVRAAELASAGVIHAAVPADELDETVAQVTARLAANAPLSLRAVKATLAARATADRRAADAMIAVARRSQDSREGVRARRERRAPQYAGR